MKNSVVGLKAFSVVFLPSVSFASEMPCQDEYDDWQACEENYTELCVEGGGDEDFCWALRLECDIEKAQYDVCTGTIKLAAQIILLKAIYGILD